MEIGTGWLYLSCPKGRKVSHVLLKTKTADTTQGKPASCALTAQEESGRGLRAARQPGVKCQRRKRAVVAV